MNRQIIIGLYSVFIALLFSGLTEIISGSKTDPIHGVILYWVISNNLHITERRP